MRWLRFPDLSIRSTVLLAIVLGVVLPALVVLVIDNRVARETHEPLVQRNRDAVLTLAANALAEPVWTLSDSAIAHALTSILREPMVCAAALHENNTVRPLLDIQRDKCALGVPVVQREVAVQHSGRTIATLAIAFDDTEVDRALAERQRSVVWLVVVQVAAGAAVLVTVLSLRLVRPIDRLKRQASAIAAREPVPSLHWRGRDELGQLGQHLNGVRSRIQELFDELERKNAQLRKMAMYDHLTGLPNRTLLRELFQHEATAARRTQRSMALLFIDLDRFKTVNDAMGHAAGDELLLGTSQRLIAALRESDLLGRLTGDEFLVLLTDAQPWDRVAATAERLLRAIETPLPLARAAHQAQVSASIGIALCPRDGEDFETLLRHADLAMYKSKELGRARYSFFHAELNAVFQSRVGLERELAGAIAGNELVLHYQPVVEALTGRVRGCEALVRWQHPERGLLMPTAFIGMAEETGLIRELGLWTLESACAQLAHWKAAGRHPGKLAINVSALQFRDQRLPETLQSALLRHAIEPGELELELTESTLMADTDTAMRTVASLRALGVALVIDDFGTGYSSLAYLKRLKPDKLKIDRSFVNDLPRDADDRALTQAIVGIANALKISVVAEGVETVAQRDDLLALGCSLQQGFLCGRPQPAAEFERSLHTLLALPA